MGSDSNSGGILTNLVLTGEMGEGILSNRFFWFFRWLFSLRIIKLNFCFGPCLSSLGSRVSFDGYILVER